MRVPVSPRGVLRSADLGLHIPSSPQSVNRALHRQKFISMRHRVSLTGAYQLTFLLLLEHINSYFSSCCTAGCRDVCPTEL